MKAFLVLLSVLFCIALATAKYTEDPVFRQFQEFQQKYGKSYSNLQEFQQRFSIFKSNLAAAKVLQANEKGSAVYGVTKFFDLTSAEFRQKYLLPKFTIADWPKAPVFPAAPNTTRPDYYGFDWNSKGVITPVYNQGQCGSCWAFSATETIESYWAIAGNTLTELSMQQIVDCDTTDSGCGGGWPYNAYNYVISAGGLESLSEYPYTAENGYCEFNAGYVVANINSWAYVTQSQDETAMYNWVNSNGPMSVCVDASSWQYYQGGVVSSCTTNLDHCVQLTGYTNGMQGYNAWDIRNSWGSDWGENGYIYLEMGQNTCGVAEVVTAVSA